MVRILIPLLVLALLPACPEGDDTLADAERLLDEGRFIEARRALIEAHGDRPTTGERAAALARAQRECGRPEEALAVLGALPRTASDLPAVREERVRALMDLMEIHRLFGRGARAGRLLATAGETVRSLVGGSRVTPRRLLLAAEVEMMLGRLGAARTWIHEARAAGADRADAEVAELRVLAKGGDRDGAAGRLEALLRDVPDHVDARLTLAAILRAGGDREAARLHVVAAVDADPLHPRAGVDLARILNALERPEDAGRAARDFLERRPDSLPALRALGVAMGALNRWSEAVEAFRHVNETHPGDPAVLNELGVSLFEGSGWKNEWLSESIRIHEQAIVIAPGDVKNAYNLCRAYTKLNQTKGLWRAVLLYESVCIARLMPFAARPGPELDMLRMCHRNVALILSDSFKEWQRALEHYEAFFVLGGRVEDDPSGGILDEWGKVLEHLDVPYRAPPEPRRR